MIVANGHRDDEVVLYKDGASEDAEVARRLRALPYTEADDTIELYKDSLALLDAGAQA